MTGDAALLQRYAEQCDEAAFRTLVERHLNLVYAAALRRTGGNGAVAEEIAQAFSPRWRETPGRSPATRRLPAGCS